jgi:D-alanyl-D-alanine carboxypeptidase/D-alanyl-D-alanine-endopeptidase (penicillin-binding protein 4)
MPYVKNSVSSKRRSRRSRGRRRRFIASLVVLLVIVAAVVMIRRARVPEVLPAAGLGSPPAGAVPVAATPEPYPWTSSELTSMRRELNDAFAPAVDGSLRHSLVVIDANGVTIFDDDGNVPSTPASVQKLIVAYTALHLLGPRYRFHTILAAQGDPQPDGVLPGDLWLVGSGDPSLRSENLRQGAVALSHLGLRSIAGRVLVDKSAMRGPEINPFWDPADANESYQTATSAVSLDRDTVEFNVYGTTTGAPARVVISPKSDDVHVSGSVTSSDGSDDVIIAAMEDPNTFLLSGDIPAGVEEKYWLPVHDIPQYVGDVFEHMLHKAGISTARGPGVGRAPLDTVVLWDHRSAPLTSLERHMLYVSDNHYAEQLLLAIAGDTGERADTADGIAAELRFLRSRNIPTKGIHVVDGSGLAEVDRIPAITLAELLSNAELHEGRIDLYTLLPRGGADGTLVNYDFNAARGRVRAKTGHLSDADSLAGYVDTRHHGRLAFAFMINDSPGDPDAAYVEAVDRLARF